MLGWRVAPGEEQFQATGVGGRVLSRVTTGKAAPGDLAPCQVPGAQVAEGDGRGSEESWPRKGGVCVRACASVYVCVRVSVHVRVCACEHLNVCVYACTRECVRVSVCERVSVCACPCAALGGRRADPPQGPLATAPFSPPPQPLVAMQLLWQQHPQTQLSPVV